MGSRGENADLGGTVVKDSVEKVSNFAGMATQGCGIITGSM